jgi:hemerythrin superfamily protein
MGIMDSVIAAVTPEASDEDRMKARAEARALSQGTGWLSMALDHHEAIEASFAAVRSATTETAQRAAQKELALILTGHSLAEETVLYPTMALTDQKAHATAAYTEQSAAKVQLSALDDLQPLSEDYIDKLEHLRAAVMHHIHEEESKWFPELRQIGDASKQSQLSRRFREEFERYAGSAERQA